MGVIVTIVRDLSLIVALLDYVFNDVLKADVYVKVRRRFIHQFLKLTVCHTGLGVCRSEFA